MVKGARDAKVKVLFQRLHMRRVIFVLVYIFKFFILTTNLFYIIYIMHPCPLSHKYEQSLLMPHFQNP